MSYIGRYLVIMFNVFRYILLYYLYEIDIVINDICLPGLVRPTFIYPTIQFVLKKFKKKKNIFVDAIGV